MKLRANCEIDVNNVELRDLEIGDKKYYLEIETNGFKGLNLRFVESKSGGCFTVHIDKERGLRLSRTLVRPNHDHNDHVDMRIDEKGVSRFCDKEYRDKSGTYKDRELAWFEFGPTRVDY